MPRHFQSGKLLLFCLVFILSENFESQNRNACELLNGLRETRFHSITEHRADQFLSKSDRDGYELNVPNEQYRFDLNTLLEKNLIKSCGKLYSVGVHVRFPRKFVLTNHINLQDLIKMLVLISKETVDITLTKLNAIEINLGIVVNNSTRTYPEGVNFTINIFNTAFDFV